MTDLEAYELCIRSARGMRQKLEGFAIDWKDAAHEMFLAWTKKGAPQEVALVTHMVRMVGFDLMRKVGGQQYRDRRKVSLSRERASDRRRLKRVSNRYRRTRTTNMHRQIPEGFEQKVIHDFTSGLYIEDLRSLCGGKYAETVDALIASDNEQKAAAKLLGISQAGVHLRLKKLKQLYEGDTPDHGTRKAVA